MAPSILIVGATGNTGQGVVAELPSLLQKSDLQSYRILALSRSAAKNSAQSSNIEWIQYTWTEITDAWLREHNIERIFIASHNEPTQFADEGQFLVNALRAGVKYVVRISTTAANVHPNYPAYYPRTHWAIETMLSQPEFKEMHWTSLQPNGFYPMFIQSCAEYIKAFRKTGELPFYPLSLVVDEDTPTGLVYGHEVGVVAAHLLVQKDTSPHDKKKYVLNGPEDITGRQLVQLVEQHIGQPVEKVAFKDVSFIDGMAEQYSGSKNVILSIKHAPVTMWEGKAKAETTSKEILELYAPRITAAEVLKGLVEGS